MNNKFHYKKEAEIIFNEIKSSLTSNHYWVTLNEIPIVALYNKYLTYSNNPLELSEFIDLISFQLSPWYSFSGNTDPELFNYYSFLTGETVNKSDRRALVRQGRYRYGGPFGKPEVELSKVYDFPQDYLYRRFLLFQVGHNESLQRTYTKSEIDKMSEEEAKELIYKLKLVD